MLKAELVNPRPGLTPGTARRAPFGSGTNFNYDNGWLNETFCTTRLQDTQYLSNKSNFNCNRARMTSMHIAFSTSINYSSQFIHRLTTANPSIRFMFSCNIIKCRRASFVIMYFWWTLTGFLYVSCNEQEVSSLIYDFKWRLRIPFTVLGWHVAVGQGFKS